MAFLMLEVAQEAAITMFYLHQPHIRRLTILVALLSCCHLPALAAPANDNFAQAEPIPPRPELLSGTTVASTLEVGEVNDNSYPFHSVWYQWIPAESGGWEVSFTNPSNGDAVLVFTGSSFHTLKQTGFVSWESSNSFWVNAGETHYLRVNAGGTGGRPFSIRFLPGPVNDAFAGRLLLPSGNGSYEASMLGASVETNEPDYLPMQGRTLWWEWIPPRSGSYFISLPNQEFGPDTSIFQGDSITALSRIATERVPGMGAMQTTFRVTGGETYLLRLAAVTFETGVIRFSLQGGPLNDDWANAEPIGSLSNIINGNTTGATYEPNEVTPRKHGGGTLWYGWVVPANGAYVARTFSSTGLGKVAVYRGNSVSNLVSLQQAAPTYSPPGESLFPFRGTAGEKLYVAVDPAGLSTGPFTLSILKPAANDNFETAETLEGNFAASDWRNFFATVEPGEPQYGGISNIGSLWWRWTAPETRSYLVHSEHDRKPVGLGVYTGTTPATLTTITTQTNSAAQVYLGFYAESGREYFIHLAHDVGTSELVRVILEPGAPNDQIANASPLVDAPATGTVSFRLATLEPDEPLILSGKGTLWWKWIAPKAGSYYFSALSPFENSELEVAAFSGVTRDELRLVGRALRFEAEAAIPFRALQGEAFHFALAERPNPALGPAWLRYALHPGPANDDFLNAILLTSQANLVNSTTRGATREPGEPNHRGQATGSSVWFTWVSPFTGKVLVGSDSTSVIGAAYKGTSVQNLEPVGPMFTAATSLDVIAGTQYLFALDSSPGRMADFMFRLGVPPMNDHYANREVITQIGATHRSWTLFGGIESIEGQSPGPSVWWTWTAPQDGVVTMETDSAGGPARAEIFYQEPRFGPPKFHGQSLLALSQTNRAAVLAGRTYDIRVVTTSPSPKVSLTLRFSPEVQPQEWSDDSFFRGGTSLWIEQPTVVHTPPAAMQAGAPPLRFEKSWIQKTIIGSGRLSFWWRKNPESQDRLVFEILALPGQAGFLAPQQPQAAWTKVEVPLINETNVLRWTAQRTSLTTNGPIGAYLDDVVFTPHSLTMLQPRRNIDGSISLGLRVDSTAGQNTWIFETSDDLRSWRAWTNKLVDSSGLSGPYEMEVTYQPAPDEPLKFFRVKR